MLTQRRPGTDLYAVLGVDASVSGDDIARAFRNRAKQLHPDTSADPDAAEKFNELVAAYDVLSNHRTRRDYDHAHAHVGAGASGAILRSGAPVGPVASASGSVSGTSRWTRGRAWTAVVAGTLVALLGVGAALLTWHLHEQDARLRARYLPVTALRTGDGDVTFLTALGQHVRTREPEQHGEGSDPGSTVAIRYDPSDPTRVIVDSNTLGRDITFAIVALKLLIGGPVFVFLGARRLRAGAVTAAR